MLPCEIIMLSLLSPRLTTQSLSYGVEVQLLFAIEALLIRSLKMLEQCNNISCNLAAAGAGL
jgi:hypothetical protein